MLYKSVTGLDKQSVALVQCDLNIDLHQSKKKNAGILLLGTASPYVGSYAESAQSITSIHSGRSDRSAAGVTTDRLWLRSQNLTVQLESQTQLHSAPIYFELKQRDWQN